MYPSSLEEETQSIAIKSLIKKYSLVPHPEGGFYAETHRQADTIPFSALPLQYSDSSYTEARNVSTTIMYLLRKQDFSRFHRILGEEQWHWYSGDPIHIHLLEKISGFWSRRILKLGNPLIHGDEYSFQAVVPSGIYFGVTCKAQTAGYSACGCVVCPGYQFDDFEMIDLETTKEVFKSFGSEPVDNWKHLFVLE